MGAGEVTRQPVVGREFQGRRVGRVEKLSHAPPGSGPDVDEAQFPGGVGGVLVDAGPGVEGVHVVALLPEAVGDSRSQPVRVDDRLGLPVQGQDATDPPGGLHRVLVERVAQFVDAVPVLQGDARLVVAGAGHVDPDHVELVEDEAALLDGQGGRLPPLVGRLDPGERDDPVVVGRVELPEHTVGVGGAVLPPLELPLVGPGLAYPARGDGGAQPDVDGVPVVEAGGVGADLVEATARLAGGAGRQGEGFLGCPFTGEGTLGGVEGGRDDRLRLVEDVEHAVGVDALDEAGVVGGDGEGAAVAEVEVELQKLMPLAERGPADHVPAHPLRPLVDLGPEVLVELSPGSRRRRGLPVDLGGVTGDGEPQDGEGVGRGLACPVERPDADPAVLRDAGEDVQLVVGRSLVVLPLDAVQGEGGGVVVVEADGLGGGGVAPRLGGVELGEDRAGRLDVQDVLDLGGGGQSTTSPSTTSSSSMTAPMAALASAAAVSMAFAWALSSSMAFRMSSSVIDEVCTFTGASRPR